MRLVTEVFDQIQCIRLDEGTGQKAHFIEGVFMQAGIANKNKRNYPRPVMESALGKFTMLINEKRALGELGHPSGPQINLDRVSHLITKLEWNGDDIIGRAKVLSTPNGLIVKNFIDEGVKLGVSSRGLGSVKALRDGISEVQNDFQLATVDIVADPSAPNAFVEGLYEGKEWVMVNGVWSEYDADQARRTLREAKSGRQLEEAKVKAFAKLIDRMTYKA
jgi:hypothetical protein